MDPVVELNIDSRSLNCNRPLNGNGPRRVRTDVMTITSTPCLDNSNNNNYYHYFKGLRIKKSFVIYTSYCMTTVLMITREYDNG